MRRQRSKLAGRSSATSTTPSTRLPKWPGGALPTNVYEDATRAYHVTLGDVARLRAGDTLELTLFDRNVWDIALNKKRKGVVYSATTMFKHSRATYVHDKDTSGTITFHFADGRELTQAFDWEIEYLHDHWYPLRHGRLHGDRRSPVPRALQKHWYKFPESTRVGFRGPCVLSKLLPHMPDVFLLDERRIQRAVAQLA
jgi:hypothetical protein